MGDRSIFDCPKCGDGKVYFYSDLEYSTCDNCGTKWRIRMNLEEIGDCNEKV